MSEKKPIGWRVKVDEYGEVLRFPKKGEWFVSSEGTVLLQGSEGAAKGARLILDPIYADDPAPAGMVPVKRDLVERLRKAEDELYAAHLRGASDDALRTLANVVSVCAHEIVVAVPPLAPADPLESEEFIVEFSPSTLGGIPEAMVGVRLEQRRAWIRKHAPEIAAFEARRAGGAK